MCSLAPTGYCTPEPADAACDAALVCEAEAPDPEGKYEGGRTMSPNIQCHVDTAPGVWSQFSFAEVLVKQEQGGTIEKEEPEHFNRGNVVPTC
eukprot:388224-Amphidinium_carterae.1